MDEFAQWGEECAGLRVSQCSRRCARGPGVLRRGVAAAHHAFARPGRSGHHVCDESFMDEMAAAAGADPVEFRLEHLDDERQSRLTAAAEKAGWDTRPSPKQRSALRRICHGPRRGPEHAQRNLRGTIAEVEVNRRTGAVRVTRFVCAHDCGLIINPEALRRDHRREPDSVDEPQPEGRGRRSTAARDQRGLEHLSRRARFGCSRASGIVLINHPEIPPSGAGEPSSRPRPPRSQRHLRRDRRARASSASHAVKNQSRARHGSARLTDNHQKFEM